MTAWHGYPQHPSTNPARPWWRYVKPPPEKVGHDDGGWHEDHHHGWQRTDGAFISLGTQVYIPGVTRYPKGTPGPLYVKPGTLTEGWDARMASHDATNPPPPPEPRCGQVWVRTLYTGDDGDPNNVIGQAFMVTASHAKGVGVGFYNGPKTDGAWPPAGCALVAGPGAPWADTSEEDGGEE